MLKRQGNNHDLEAFNITKNWSLDEWRRLHTAEYWKVMNAIPVRDRHRRSQYRLQCIKRLIND